MSKFKLQISLIIAVLLSLGLYLWGKQIPKETIEGFVQSAGPLAPIVYVIIHQISFVFAPISGFPFAIAGFYLFGKDVVIYHYFVVLIGSSINFWIAKKWGRGIVKKLAGKETLIKIDELSKKYGIAALVILRMIQGGIGDFVSYAYGLTPMKYSTYIIITALAIIPGNVIWYIAVSKTNTIEQSLAITIILPIIAVIIFIAGNFSYKEFKKHG